MSFISKLFKKETKRKTAKRSIGDIGEDVACEHLASLGYKILARNVQISHKEIDIVAEDDQYTLIVEVKTTSMSKSLADSQGKRPRDNIDREKAKNVLSAARSWCSRNYTGRSPRVDVIEVYLGDTPPTLTHIENAINTRTLYRKRR